jgi:hypothetical protein
MGENAVLAKRVSALENRIQERILLRTWGRIKQLHLAVKDEKVVVWGYVPSYYLRQLAIQAVREVMGSQPFEDAIEVIEEAEAALAAAPW